MKKKNHLVSWTTIAMPKILGGWGLKNISYFGKALATKSIWRDLFGTGLWSSLIYEKYLKHVSPVQWIRVYPSTLRNASNVWITLVRTFSIIGDWIIWKI